MTVWKTFFFALGALGIGAAIMAPSSPRRALSGTREIANAIDAYRTENHGALPISIDELVTERFLDHPPIDPWGQRFEMRCDASSCDVWSKGKNTVAGDNDDIRTQIPIL
jgi:hypothetical protein